MASGAMLIEVSEQSSPTAEPKLTHYYVHEMPADFGRAFEWAKFGCQGGEVYHVNIGDDANPASCTCPGHTYHGDKGIVCKHIAATRALIAEAML
jgi:hypothetical protein